MQLLVNPLKPRDGYVSNSPLERRKNKVED
uniref:Uncharacterized protein n=1 Tax=Rhizophora mucronata TaxID=61149 RepID=A0A2P2II86_RHIMU